MTAIAAFVKDGVGIAITDTCMSLVDSSRIEGYKKIFYSNNCLIGIAGSVNGPILEYFSSNIERMSMLDGEGDAVLDDIKKYISENHTKLLQSISCIVMKDCKIFYTPFNLNGTILNVTSCSIGNGGTELQTSIETVISHNDINLLTLSLEEIKRLGQNALKNISNKKNGISADCYVYKQTSVNNIFTTTNETQTYELMGQPKKQIKAFVATNKKCSDNWVISDENLQDIANFINATPVPMVLLDDNGGHYEGAVVNQIGDWTNANVCKVSGTNTLLLEATGETLNHDIDYSYSTSIALNVIEGRYENGKKITKKVAVQDIAITKKPADESCLIIQAMSGNDFQGLSIGEIKINDLTNNNDMSDQNAPAATFDLTPVLEAIGSLSTKIENMAAQKQVQVMADAAQEPEAEPTPEAPQTPTANQLEEEVQKLKAENEDLKKQNIQLSGNYNKLSEESITLASEYQKAKASLFNYKKIIEKK